MNDPDCIKYLNSDVAQKQLHSGIVEMDLAHQAIIKELTILLSAPETEINQRLQHIITLLEADFREEEVVMERLGFNELSEHREHHAKLLSALHHVVPSALSGEYELARQVLKMLPQWFLGHLVKMDKPLIEALHATQAQTRELLHL